MLHNSMVISLLVLLFVGDITILVCECKHRRLLLNNSLYSRIRGYTQSLKSCFRPTFGHFSVIYFIVLHHGSSLFL